MSSQKIKDYSQLEVQADFGLFLEKRIENDGSGNPIYVGYVKYPQGSTSQPDWFIIKLSYSGGFLVRSQLPDAGAQFNYAWDDRASLFT